MGYTGQHILMVDNHDSHKWARPIQAAMLNNIVIFTFPSHFTHLVQMLDVCFFGSFKANFKRVCKTWLDEQDHAGKPYISKLIFLRLFHTTWVGACKPKTFKNSWARMGLSSCPETGIVVINRRTILDVCLGGSEKYQEGVGDSMDGAVYTQLAFLFKTVNNARFLHCYTLAPLTLKSNCFVSNACIFSILVLIRSYIYVQVLIGQVLILRP
jgi:hypothetical protein